VLGLDLSASAVSYDGTPGTVLGAGFGWMGQNVLELQGLYDVSNGSAGMRANFVYALGEKGFSLPISMSVEMFFDFKGHPVPGLILFGLGGGSGFRW
jgi:hypothetical protein